MRKIVAIFAMILMFTQSVYATEPETNNTESVDTTENTGDIESNKDDENAQNTDTNKNNDSEQLGQIVKPSITESINTNSNTDLNKNETVTNINNDNNTNTNTNINNTNDNNDTFNKIDLSGTQKDNVEDSTQNDAVDEVEDYNPENSNYADEGEDVVVNQEQVSEAQSNNNQTMKLLVWVLVGLGILIIAVSVYLTRRKRIADKDINAKLKRERELLLQNIPKNDVAVNKFYEVEIVKDNNLGGVYIATNNIGEIDDYINQLERPIYNDNLSYYHKGIQAFDRRDYEEAEKLFRLQIQYNYYVIESYMYLMEIHIVNKNYDGALEEINKILMKEPKNEQAITIKMEILTRLKRYNECILEYTELIVRDDDRKYEFMLARALCKMALGKYESAIHDYDMVIEDNPENAEAYFNRGLANIVLKNNEIALEDIKMAVIIDEAKYNDKGNMLISKLERELE